MQSDLYLPSDQQLAPSTGSAGNEVPESLSGLLGKHGVDAGADSRLHFARRHADGLTISSMALALMGLGQGMAMTAADGWHLAPAAMALLAGVAALIACLRLNDEAPVPAAAEIVASLLVCGAMVAACGAAPEALIAGLNIQQVMAGSFLVVSSVVVACGFIDRYSRIGSWSRTAASAAALAATLLAMA